LLELELAEGRVAEDRRSLVGAGAFRWFLERRLEGVEVDIRYPTYMFGGVLCTHGNYPDFYASRAGAVPGRLLARLIWSIAVGQSDQEPLVSVQRAQAAAYETAMASETERRRRTGPPGGGELARRALGQVARPQDSYQPPVAALERVVMRLAWARDTDKIVFAHTHQPLEDVRGPSGAVRSWNTGSWIYEPDFATHEAYVRYLENAWRGTAVLIDTGEPLPRLLRLREHLNPLYAGGATVGNG